MYLSIYWKIYQIKKLCITLDVGAQIENDKALVFWSYQIRSSSPERIVPPDIPSTLYPKLEYSSHNEFILRHHCSILSSIGIDAMFLCYFGTNHSDFFNVGFDKFSIQTLGLLINIVPD